MNNLKTVIEHYESQVSNSEHYQSEAQLENKLINDLKNQGYEYLSIHNNDELLSNLRKQIEILNKDKLNNRGFSDSEWKRFTSDYLLKKGKTIKDKTELIQKNNRFSFRLDNDEYKNISIIDTTNPERNIVQVINQYEANEGNYKNRYDVTILVNGLPLVHLELKRRGIDIKEAFNQIQRYQRDSFWSDSGLFEFVQIFIISNGTYTKYYSNTTRDNIVFENSNLIKSNQNDSLRSIKTSNSFEFTSYWSDQRNKNIMDLDDFVKTFLDKKTLLNVLTKYCVFTATKSLLVMRPYQITATEAIINRINQAYLNQKWGQDESKGYVWHTTGSGKTLTSFKTAQLATQLDFIDKVIFVVDRKDLDYQTMNEYDKFEKGCVNSNTSSAVLQRQLEDNSDNKIIVTTIQKLNALIKKNSNHPIYDKQVVFIFDECHRSQFGEMHKKIINNFKKYYMFGFTGTPIFAQNANPLSTGYHTTESLFIKKLHTYTILNAIADKNVLPFKVSYCKTIQAVDDLDNKSGKEANAINIDEIYLAPERINKIVNYIMDNFKRHTYRSKTYKHNVINNLNDISSSKQPNKVEKSYEVKSINGFNSILAVSSIEAAKEYYKQFKVINATKPEQDQLKIGLIYSYAQNEDVDGFYKGFDEENNENINGLDEGSRAFLDSAIKDYNEMFGTSWDTSSDKFQSYYKDVSLRLKNKELDILIVVNMFLTGFDATTLNTLWVDKNLQMHGLVQAFSRTNRILNAVKQYGNIVCFRNLEDNANEAFALFGDENAHGQILLREFKDYYEGYINERGRDIKGYKELVETLKANFKTNESINSETQQKEFISLFGSILRLTNLLTTFDEFEDKCLLDEKEMQDYQGIYLRLKQEWKQKLLHSKETIVQDVVFEVELIKQNDINWDYIVNLIQLYADENHADKEALLISLQRVIEASSYLHNLKELILDFLRRENKYDWNSANVTDSLASYIAERRNEELKQICTDNEIDNFDEVNEYIKDSFEQGEFSTLGEGFDRLLSKGSMFDSEQQKSDKKIKDALREFFNKYFEFYTHTGIEA